MFGYIKTYKPELKIREFEVYRGAYCSLCQTLGKRYGIAARMTLSYDFTFLALFIMALNDEKIVFRRGRCPFNPTKTRMLCDNEHNEALNFSADVAMLLVYHKLSDTMADERFWKRLKARVARFFMKRDYKRAVKRRPLEAEAALIYMKNQTALEQARVSSVDAAAEPTAALLSTLACAATPEDVHDIVKRFGYCLGRFIYLADAADDMAEDLKSGSYNPYLLNAVSDYAEITDLSAIQNYASQSLHACVAVCAECYEQLSVKRFDGILKNVLYYGMPWVIKTIQNGQQEEPSHEKSL